AAPSGVGVTTLILAKYLGARVIGTSRSAEKLERLKQHGLDVGVVTGSDGFGAAIAPVIGENGVDMVVDNLGGDVLAPCIAALAVGGRFVMIGRMSGVLTGELDVDRLAERRLHLYGVSNRLRRRATRRVDAAVCRRSDARARRRPGPPDHRPLFPARRPRRRASPCRGRPPRRQGRHSSLAAARAPTPTLPACGGG